jgi:NADPH:quinone reductase-like Zn-dependent oxidoreductase
MQAVVVHEPGGPDVLRLEDCPIPSAHPGWVLVRVRAFGLNQSELLTRASGQSDAVRFPRVLGIECAGEVIDAPDSDLQPGGRIVALRGGMGRDYDGSYAQYALLPETRTIPVQSTLDWASLGALPESFGAAWATLEELKLHNNQSLLVHDCASSEGMAAIALAKERGLIVLAGTRQEAKRAVLESAGADHVILIDSDAPDTIRAVVPDGVNGLCELVKPTTAIEVLQALSTDGRACITRHTDTDRNMQIAEAEAQRLGVTLRHFSNGIFNRYSYGDAFQKIVNAVQDGHLTPNLEQVYPMSQITDAHRYMEENPDTGKIVVLPPEN